MDCFLLLIFASAVFEQTWCVNNSSNTTTETATAVINTTFTTATTSTTTTTAVTSTTTTTAVTSTTTSTAVTSTTTTTAVTSPSLVCQNKGTFQNGICLCPDDWTGATCNISNFCPEQNIPAKNVKFTFLKTVLGQFASSVEQCPSNSLNAGISQASALCSLATRSFDPPQILDCGLTLDKINSDLSNADEATKKNLALSTQILTSIPERLTSSNITNAVKITNSLLSTLQTLETTSSSQTQKEVVQNITVSAVATVSQLMSASHGAFTSVDPGAISELTKTLQDVSLRDNSNSLLVQPNMAVQSLTGQTLIQQVQLTSFKGQRDTFLPDRIKLLTTQTDIFKDKIDLQMNITFNQGFDKGIGFVLYDSDRLFQSKTFQPSLDTKRRVISASLQGTQGLDQIKFSVTSTDDPTVSVNDFACVFWSYSKNDWSTEGCTKTESPSGQPECSCKPENLGKANFAILMVKPFLFQSYDGGLWTLTQRTCTEKSKLNNSPLCDFLQSFDINYQYSEALQWISIIGCALSVLGLSITAVYQIVTRKSRGGSPTLLLVNVCVSMTVFYLLFIFGINNPVQHLTVAKVFGQNTVPDSDQHKYPDQGPCTAFTALLQFFLLATFTWNTLYGVNVFLLFKNNVSGTPAWFPKVALPVGWVVPAVIVGITLGSTYRVNEPLSFRQEEFCWLAALDPKQNFSFSKPMFWGFLLPLMFMLISNMAILLHFSNNICRTNPNLNSSRKTPLKKKILSSVSLAVMLGLSWVAGYLLLISRETNLRFILSVVFCLLNTTQGVQIFILFTLRSVLNSNPALLEALHPPAISFHRQTFSLWKNNIPDNSESYRSTVMDT